VQAFEQVVAIEPDSAAGWQALGGLQFAQGNPERAQQALERATQLAPNDVSVHRALSEVYAQIGQEEKALEALERAVKLAPTDGELLALFRRDMLRRMSKHRRWSIQEAAERLHFDSARELTRAILASPELASIFTVDGDMLDIRTDATPEGYDKLIATFTEWERSGRGKKSDLRTSSSRTSSKAATRQPNQ
jgi:tetratricopeptide (TPR) repeat protein